MVRISHKEKIIYSDWTEEYSDFFQDHPPAKGERSILAQQRTVRMIWTILKVFQPESPSKFNSFFNMGNKDKNKDQGDSAATEGVSGESITSRRDAHYANRDLSWKRAARDAALGSLYCDLGATPWRWSSVLFKVDTSVWHKYSTITGTGIVHPSLTHFKLLCSFIGYLIHRVHCLL